MEKSTIFQDTKKHYEILDALRGIAAILVIVFHLFEIFSGGDPQNKSSITVIWLLIFSLHFLVL